MELKTINYKGKTLVTKFWKEISDEQYNNLVEQYYSKPDFDLVKKEFKNIHGGGTKNSNITNYYVKDLMAKTQIYYNKWSIEDVFNCKELLETFYAKIFENNKVYPSTSSDIKNIETALRLGGKGVASKPANYPIKSVDEILNNYNINNNYYDFSCGWGARLVSSLKNNMNYFGTDPNYLLTERLEKIAKDYKEVNNTQTNVDIRSHGSEIFIPEWENKIGVAFSSPPYFYLEDYKIGEQSYKDGTTYQEWLDNYLKPTISNIYLYLVYGGAFIININNFDKYDLVNDVTKIALDNGFVQGENHKLENIKRANSNGGFNDNSESIMVFYKD